MTLIFDVFFDILAKWEKMAEKNMFFERSIFDDFLDGQKSRSQDEKNHWVFAKTTNFSGLGASLSIFRY